MARASSSRSVYQKIVAAHLEEGEIVPGRTISLKIVQTATYGGIGTLACLEFEAMSLDRVATDLSASYAGPKPPDGPDDHAYLETAAARFGMFFSRIGNGPAHVVHVERFAVPGKTIAGTHGRVVACGAVGMLALPASGLEVAVAMGGGTLQVRCPEVVQVFLRGKLKPNVSPRDVALELLRRRSRRGGAGKVFEFSGPGVKTIPVEERATIAVLCGELGAVTAVFPSDERTRSFLQAERRIKAYRRIEADADATYDDREEIDLGAVEPMIAGPEPIGVRPVREAHDQTVRGAQVGAGGHATARDLLALAAVLKGRRVQSNAPLVASPGSRQVLAWAAAEELPSALATAGAKVLEADDGNEITGGVVVRVSANGGTIACLVSAETAGASAVQGEVTDPRTLKRVPKYTLPRRLPIDDALLVRAQKDGSKVEIRRGPHVAPLPPLGPMPPDLSGRVLVKVGDDVGDESLLPPEDDLGGRQSNLALLAELVFSPVDPEFARRARDWGGGCIVAGQQYGLGERRESSALAPRLLGVRVVLARSFARPHLLHLVHFGILPLTFLTGRDYDSIGAGDELHVPEAAARLKVGRPVIVENRSSGRQIEVRYDLSDREREILVDGGLLAYTRRRARKGKEAVAA